MGNLLCHSTYCQNLVTGLGRELSVAWDVKSKLDFATTFWRRFSRERSVAWGGNSVYTMAISCKFNGSFDFSFNFMSEFGDGAWSGTFCRVGWKIKIKVCHMFGWGFGRQRSAERGGKAVYTMTMN